MTITKPRIAHVVALNTVGGVERLYADFLQLSKNDFVHITINDRDSIASSLAPSVTQLSEQVHSIKKWKHCRLPKWPRSLRQLNLKRILRQAQPDLIVVWNKPEGLGNDQSFFKVPVIYYEHGAGWTGGENKQIKSFLSQVDAVICCSEAALQVLRLQWQLPTTTPAYICHNSISQDIWHQPRRKDTALPPAAFRVGLAARLVPLKGSILALEAIKLLKNWGFSVELHIAGTGSEEHKLKQRTKELGLTNDVIFHGLVKDMPGFYKNIECLLCPSLREPFGIVAIEAMASGVPVIGTNIDGLAEVIEHKVTGLLIQPTLSMSEYEKLGGSLRGVPAQVYDPAKNQLVQTTALSPLTIANNIKRLIEDKNLYKSLSEAAYVISRDKFNPGRQLNELTRVLKDSTQAASNRCLKTTGN